MMMPRLGADTVRAYVPPRQLQVGPSFGPHGARIPSFVARNLVCPCPRGGRYDREYAGTRTMGSWLLQVSPHVGRGGPAALCAQTRDPGTCHPGRSFGSSGGAVPFPMQKERGLDAVLAQYGQYGLVVLRWGPVIEVRQTPGQRWKNRRSGATQAFGGFWPESGGSFGGRD